MQPHVGPHQISGPGQTIGLIAFRHGWQQRRDMRIVPAQHRQTVEGNLVDECDECLHDPFQRPIVIQMLAVHVRDHDDRRGQL